MRSAAAVSVPRSPGVPVVEETTPAVAAVGAGSSGAELGTNAAGASPPEFSRSARRPRSELGAPSAEGRRSGSATASSGRGPAGNDPLEARGPPTPAPSESPRGDDLERLALAMPHTVPVSRDLGNAGTGPWGGPHARVAASAHGLPCAPVRRGACRPREVGMLFHRHVSRETCPGHPSSSAAGQWILPAREGDLPAIVRRHPGAATRRARQPEADWTHRHGPRSAVRPRAQLHAQLRRRYVDRARTPQRGQRVIAGSPSNTSAIRGSSEDGPGLTGTPPAAVTPAPDATETGLPRSVAGTVAGGVRERPEQIVARSSQMVPGGRMVEWRIVISLWIGH
jgi:hypothetical protein